MHEFLFVRSYGHENALARLQSAPLIAGLAELGHDTHLWQISPNRSAPVAPEHRCWVYHHDDNAAIQALIQAKQQGENFSICLSSDIYNIDRYVSLEPYTDLFCVPTLMHQAVLRSAVSKPVHVVPECVDPICYPPAGWQPGSGAGPAKTKILWFGYPESFLKSFKHLIPALNGAITVQDLVVITNHHTLINQAEHRDFDFNSFYVQTTDIRFSLLSHFSYDNQLNTWLKSPNKLVTSIVRGMVPFASATPAYVELLAPYDLSGLLFTRPDDLRDQLRHREKLAQTHETALKAAAQDLEEKFSFASISRQFLNCL